MIYIFICFSSLNLIKEELYKRLDKLIRTKYEYLRTELRNRDKKLNN
jgi:hypothetical protein